MHHPFETQLINKITSSLKNTNSELIHWTQ